MKIDTISVNEFSTQEEYPGYEIESNGETRLLYGPNVSGKTVTFCAVAHAILHHSMGIDVGSGSSVEIEFTDGSVLHRGQPRTTFSTERHDSESENVKDRLTEVIGHRPTLAAYFLHSNTEKLPLGQLPKEQILDVARGVTVPGVQDEIADIRSDLHDTREDLNETLEDREEKEEEIEDVDGRIQRAQQKNEVAEKVVRLGNTGELEEIRDTLERRDELTEELESLLDEQRELESDLEDAEDRLEELEHNLHEPTDLLIEAISESEACPVCETTVPRDIVEERDADGSCPLCGIERSIESYRDGFEEANQTAVEEIDDTRAEVERLEERLDEIGDEIEDVQSQKPALSELDAETRQRLEAHDRQLSAVVDAAREDRDATADRLVELREKRERLERQLDDLDDDREELRETADALRNEIAELESEARDGISEFTDTWRRVLEEMTGTIRREIDLRREQGVIVGGTPRRVYGEGKLSDAERQLLNLSFAIAVNQQADADRVALDTLIIDEPFGHFDETVREEVLEYVLADDDRQYIFTSSDEAVAATLGPDRRDTLETDNDEQWNISDFDDEKKAA